MSGVAGSILDGEDEPEYAGKFSMKLIVSAGTACPASLNRF